VCGSEEFTAASTPCPREFEMWGREGHIKGDKPGRFATYGKEMQITHTVSRGPAIQTTGCASTVKMVYWCYSLNTFGSQLFDH